MRGAGFLSFVLDLLLDPRCVHCGGPLLRGGGCPPSLPAGWPRESLEFFRSGFTIDLGLGVKVPAEILCGGCWFLLEPAHTGLLSDGVDTFTVIAPFTINDTLLEVIRFMKFGRGRTAAPSLSWWMAHALMKHLRGNYRFSSLSNIVILPVPLHRARKRSRGYNQAALLADGVCRLTGLKKEEYALERVRGTKPQSKLDSRAKRSNVSGAFRMTGRVALSSRDIILVDDLVTTGETMRACIAALREAAPSSITILAAGRKGRSRD